MEYLIVGKHKIPKDKINPENFGLWGGYTPLTLVEKSRESNVSSNDSGLRSKLFETAENDKYVQMAVQRLDSAFHQLSEHKDWSGVHSLRQLAEELYSEIEASRPIVFDLLGAMDYLQTEFESENIALTGRDRLLVHSLDVCMHGCMAAVEANAYHMKKGMEPPYDKKSMRKIAMGGLLHDIGKLEKQMMELWTLPRKLTDDEREEMKLHTQYGLIILQEYQDVLGSDLLDCVAFHHEKPDGSGHFHVSDDDYASDESKVISVADKFAAMFTERRRYRDEPVPNFWNGAFLAEVFGYRIQEGKALVEVPENYPENPWGKVTSAFERLFRNGVHSHPDKDFYSTELVLGGSKRMCVFYQPEEKERIIPANIEEGYHA
ncbi:HD domain-containing protein [Candidatus Woesearchaeota archaeon]|nr:HD domain-containing protein [Candidatus Woesearchaeota archaeon]